MVSPVQQRFYDFDVFRVDVSRRLLMRQCEPVPLTPKAFDILLVLVQNRGRVVEKDERLIVVILKIGALPLVRNAPGDGVHFRPSPPLQRTKAQKRMLPDRPSGIWKCCASRGVNHGGSR